MIGWALFIFLVAPFLFAGVAISRMKPAPLPNCPKCRDGHALTEIPIYARDEFKLVLRCPQCEQKFGAKISEGSLTRMTDQEFEKTFSSDSLKKI
jgi:hypothetical protein